jgi:hypothetical protein
MGQKLSFQQNLQKKQKIIYLSNNNLEHLDVWSRSMANTYQGSKQNFIYRNGCAKAISKKIRDRKNKNEHIKEIMRVKEKPNIIDIIERKRLQWYGHVKKIQEERLPKLIMEEIPGERRKRGRPRKTWMEGVRAAMKTRHLETDQWLNRKE